MTYIVTVSSKRQFTIPKAIREQLGITPGDHVSLHVENGQIVLRPVRGIVAETAGRLSRSVRRVPAKQVRR
jgi:AbrB family looped-hinge helix DNA binding protein